MSSVSEVIALYRHDNHVNDRLFELLLFDAFGRDAAAESEMYSRMVTPEEFFKMTQDPKEPTAAAVRASVERGI